RDVSFAYAGATSSTGFPPLPEIANDQNGDILENGNRSRGRDARATVLRNVSITIEPGKTVALCGPSGSGKPTILNLLVRFYDPIEGVVTLDGRDLRAIARDSLRSHFALVQQETFLFNDSILDNVRYGHGEATMEQVIAAARAAN